MTGLKFVALATETVQGLRAGDPDANGQAPERQVSDGSGLPCRHCLGDIAAGEPFLILAHRPFPEPQPYAETGPIFLHAEPCERHGEVDEVPALFLSRAQLLIRGNGADDRIVYGTGQVVPSAGICSRPPRSPTCTCVRPATTAISAGSSAGRFRYRYESTSVAFSFALPMRPKLDDGGGIAGSFPGNR